MLNWHSLMQTIHGNPVLESGHLKKMGRSICRWPNDNAMEIGHGGVRFLPNLSFHLALPLLPRPTPVIVFDVLHLPSVRRHIEHEKGKEADLAR